MSHSIRWILAASLALGLGLTGCRSATAPPFPQDNDEGDEDPNGGDPGQAMIQLHLSEVPAVV